MLILGYEMCIRDRDIIRFHTIYWPIFLMALDLPLPKQVFGHPWLLQGDGKMSKSKGNVLYADTLVDFFGVDAVRYFVLHEMPFDNDGVISWELMVERMNSDPVSYTHLDVYKRQPVDCYYRLRGLHLVILNGEREMLTTQTDGVLLTKE